MQHLMFKSQNIGKGKYYSTKLQFSIPDFEKRSLEATASVQQTLGKPVIIHPGRDAKALFETMRVYTEAGGDPKLTIMSHLDSKLFFSSQISQISKQHIFN